MIGFLYDLGKLAILKLLVLYEYAERKLRPVSGKIIRKSLGEQAPGSRPNLCVFAHFDRDGVIDDYVVHYLKALARLDCETVVVSTAEGLGEDEVAKVLPFCSRFIVKQNIGYDFASWRTALEEVKDFSGYERVIVANDSVYGPLQDLRGIFGRMSGRNLSFWGITDSLRYGRHLQSYFMVFERPVLDSLVFRNFWKELPDYLSKHVVIAQCEVGLSRTLASAGFRFGAYNEVEDICQEVSKERGRILSKILGCRFNSTHIGWRSLLRSGCPFVKVQLLRDNPKGLPDVAEWEHVVDGLSGYDAGLIRRHLARMSSGGN